MEIVRRGLATRAGWTRVLVVTVYAAAMGYVEAAAVVYIRLIVGGVDPMSRVRTPPPIPLGPAEVGREAATIVMLATVALLAGRRWSGRWGAFVLAFGVWDITYYLFLALLVGWPRSVLDWDILFLIPLPWWGPVLAPTLIAAAMCLSGAVLLLREARGDRPTFPRAAASAGVLGALLCLYVFMAEAVAALAGSGADVRTLRPTTFPWPLFLLGYVPLAWGFLGVALAPNATSARLAGGHSRAAIPARIDMAAIPEASVNGGPSSSAPDSPTAAVGPRDDGGQVPR